MLSLAALFFFVILAAVSAVAFGADQPPPPSESRFTWEGIHVIWIILGLIGAALGVGSMPEMTRKQLWTSLGSGLACAIVIPWVLPDAIAWWRNVPAHPLPVPVTGAIAFFLGIGGMFIVPGFIVFWASVKRNPFGFLDWIRGRNPTPPQVDDPTEPRAKP